MSIKITGVLKDALGKPISGCNIRLTAMTTSATVITTTRGDTLPDAAGSYSLDVEPGRYKISLMIPGWPPEDVGRIEVTAYSQPGTLNDFLTRTQSGDLSLDIMARFEQLAAQVAEEARQTAKDSHDADNSAGAAKTSETNAAASATASAESATHAHSSETAAKASEASAEGSATAAAVSQVAARASEDNAKSSETAAAGSKTAAATSETSAAGSATAAKTSETNAATSASAAHTSETNAHASEQAAAQHAADAQGVVAGTGRLIALKKIEVSVIYTPSPGAKFIIFEVTGAGGSGTTLNAHSSLIYTPGGDGGYVKFMDTDVQPSYPITIGAPLPGGMGGSTTIGFPDRRKVTAWGGNASVGVAFDGSQPSEPRQILVAAGGGI